jgi:DNA-directed RNA polymerase subunit omega
VRDPIFRSIFPQGEERMNSQLLEEASKVVRTPQVLINMVSKRVRQLSNGARPLVEVTPKMGLADIALQEIATGKLAFEASADSEDGSST